MERNPVLIQRARQLRLEMTDAEWRLWSRLRLRQLDGHRFRRQAPIGSYVVDFVCLSSRLVIELDGGQHNEADIEALDAQRTDWLNSKGYRVLRFWNSEVLTEIEDVMEAIFNALAFPEETDLALSQAPS